MSTGPILQKRRPRPSHKGREGLSQGALGSLRGQPLLCLPKPVPSFLISAEGLAGPQGRGLPAMLSHRGLNSKVHTASPQYC